ncbi:MAG: site-specific DNA-methyltransferase [Alloprevotella sp.]|nr:site-specific DNA-methyltransferase [Alloprevotella sp.]
MSAIEQYIQRIANEDLQQQLREEIGRLTKKKRFGLVWENHLPDNVQLPEVRIRRGTKVALRDKTPNDVYEVQSLTETEAVCINLASMEQVTLPLADLIAVAQRGDIIYPYLKPMDSVQNAPESDLWHTLIEADNYHALQLLSYLYAGQVDCIYIDPPYNKPDSHDWKYNCDYVDGTDSYRHSKWLSMMEARLKIAKKLLNPKDSVLIVTIDELEYHHLGCLLEQMFPEARIQMVTSVISAKGVVRTGQFSRVEEYLYIVEFGSSQLSQFEYNMLDSEIKKESNREIEWLGFRRRAPQAKRESRPNQFYPIFIDPQNGTIHSIGEVLPHGVDRNSVLIPEGCKALWPLSKEGDERLWSLQQKQALINWRKGYLKVNWNNKTKLGTIYYLPEGTIADIESGKATTLGYNDDGSIKAMYYVVGTTPPKKVWNMVTHNAETYGTNILNDIIGKRFDYPKSLYAVHDVLRFFVANKLNALILDFFAGSGTTLHAVNLLNAEDGGHRRCIMVTNNEIGEPKEKELHPQGLRPGDEEWERWGIARYVNWPRTKCSILGTDVNGLPIEGNYLTSLTETKERDRKFTQINFLPLMATLKQKKTLVTLINKQKGVKLPTMTTDAPYLLSEDDSYNASILFDVTKTDEWMEALEGNDHITNYFIVTDKDSAYRQIKNEVSELMGKIEETIPVEMPMRNGFKANAAYFKLGFLDKRSVERGRQLQELLPLLWMKAGAKGECPKQIEGNYAIWPENRMALLTDEAYFTNFQQELKQHNQIDVVYLITDSQTAYLNMTAELKGRKTYQLYRDYLENFRINYAVK